MYNKSCSSPQLTGQIAVIYSLDNVKNGRMLLAEPQKGLHGSCNEVLLDETLTILSCLLLYGLLEKLLCFAFTICLFPEVLVSR